LQQASAAEGRKAQLAEEVMSGKMSTDEAADLVPKLGLSKQPDNAKLFLMSDLEPVAKDVSTGGAKASTQITPKTQAELSDIENRMRAAGGERAQPAKKLEAVPIAPPPVKEIMTPDRYRQIMEAEESKRANYKPGVTEEVRSTPPPPKLEEKSPVFGAERIRDKQLLESLPIRIKRLPEGPMKAKLQKQLEDLKAKYASKVAAPIPPPAK
jgi:hypothetical protein